MQVEPLKNVEVPNPLKYTDCTDERKLAEVNVATFDVIDHAVIG